MKLPIYTEVSFESLNHMDLKDIKKAIRQSRVGLKPTYIVTTQLASDLLLDFLNLLSEALDEMKISSKFPYPLYIISEELTSHPEFQIISKVEKLPSHFFKKVKRLKGREQTLLTKIEVLTEKLTNVEVNSKLDLIKSQATKNKDLYEICLELDIYEKILNQLAQTAKENK